jgi:hypothetical protein
MPSADEIAEGRAARSVVFERRARFWRIHRAAPAGKLSGDCDAIENNDRSGCGPLISVLRSRSQGKSRSKTSEARAVTCAPILRGRSVQLNLALAKNKT